MEDQNNATSGKHHRSASNAPNDRRQKMTTPSCPATPLQNEGVLAAMNKLTQLLEHHPQLHSKLEGMLEGVFNALESEVSATIRKEKNEDSCPIFKLSNDELKLVFGYAGEKQYGFVGYVSDRFHHIYLDALVVFLMYIHIYTTQRKKELWFQRVMKASKKRWET